MDISLNLAGDAGAAIGMVAAVVLLCWIVQTIGKVKVANRRAEVWLRLVERLDAAGIHALLTDPDHVLLEGLLAGQERPHVRIITTAQAGAVFLFVSVVLIAYSAAGADIPSIMGAIGAAIGGGLLAAAAIAYWLADRWGLLTTEPQRSHRG